MIPSHSYNLTFRALQSLVTKSPSTPIASRTNLFRVASSSPSSSESTRSFLSSTRRINRSIMSHSQQCNGCAACTSITSAAYSPPTQSAFHSSSNNAFQSHSLTMSPTNAASSTSVSRHSAIHPSEPSAFLRGRGSAANTPATTNAYKSAVKGPLPSHIHSSTCGCGADAMVLDGDSTGTIKGGATPSKWNVASLLEHNSKFVEGKAYEPLLTDRYPFKKLVIVSCMDTRLTQLLPLALDLKNGDAKIIKVAGAMVAHPFGSVMRSILVAVYGLGAEHILVVGHHDCGMTGMDPKKILDQAQARGIPESTFKTLGAAGLNLNSWLSGFESVESSVLNSCETIRNHPLLSFNSGPKKLSITGMVIDPTTGKLDLVTPPDEATQKLFKKLNSKQQKQESKAQ